MPSAREDYLLRMIQQIAAVVARLRERLTGATAVAEAPDIEREAGAAITNLLGPQGAVLQALDPGSAVRLVANPDRVDLWVALMRVQVEARRARGQIDAADQLSARADAIERVLRSVQS